MESKGTATATAPRARVRVLVTGATGLVGRAIMALNAELEGGIEFVGAASADADLRDFTATVALLRREQIAAAEATPGGRLDGIIHLAANVGGLFKNMKEPVEMAEDNLLMNVNVLRAAHRCDVDNVIMCLSTCIFPDLVPEYPIRPVHLHDGPPHPSNEGYAYAKRMCDVLTRAYQRQYGRRYFCVVPTNVYGPGDNYDLANAHVVPALIHKCWKARAAGAPFVVAGDGTPLRQFIYSEDLARLIAWAYVHYENVGEPLFLCPPDCEVPIRRVVGLIADAMDYGDRVVYDTTLPNGQFKKTAAAFPYLNVPPDGFTPLEVGIAKSVAWFLESVEAGAPVRGVAGAAPQGI